MVQQLKAVSKHFFKLFDRGGGDWTEYFREVFGSMFIPTIYVQLYAPPRNNDGFDQELLLSNMKLMFKNQFEIISDSEFEIEFDFPRLLENEQYILDNLDSCAITHHYNESDTTTTNETNYLLKGNKTRFGLVEKLLDWKYNSKNSLTLNNFTSLDLRRKKKVNAFRFAKKFKFHFQLTQNFCQFESEVCSAKWFNTLLLENDRSIRKENHIILMAFLNFIEYADKYGEFELDHIYNKQDMKRLQTICKEGSTIDLVDFLTIERNIMLHFTQSFLSNNTKLIRYTPIYSKDFPTKLHSALGIIENLSLIPWNEFRNSTRIQFSSIILYHIFKDEMNISEDYLTQYRNSHNLSNTKKGEEQLITYISMANEFILTFQTLQFERTLAIIRNNHVSIPHYPSQSLKGFSHSIPLNEISTTYTSLNSFNECCMNYCTFNTISAPLCCIPCCCWWSAMGCCCMYPCCYRKNKGCGLECLLDSQHKYMSCLDVDVGLFVALNTLFYPCCLLKLRVTGGPYSPKVESWTVRDDKFFGHSRTCNIL